MIASPILLFGAFVEALPGNLLSSTSAKSPQFQKDINAKLFNSCRYENLPGIKRAISNGADINSGFSSYNGKTPLFSAVISNNFELVKFLVDAGADLNAKDKFGNTPFSSAVSCGSVAMIKLLLSMRSNDKTAINLNQGDRIGPYAHLLNSGQEPALLTAVYRGEPEIVQTLIDSGADPNVIGRLGVTPLIAAARKGNEDIVRILLDSGANKNAVDDRDRTASEQLGIRQDIRDLINSYSEEWRLFP